MFYTLRLHLWSRFLKHHSCGSCYFYFMCIQCFVNQPQVCPGENPDRCWHAGWSPQWYSPGWSAGSETLAVWCLVHWCHCSQQNGGWGNTRVRTDINWPICWSSFKKWSYLNPLFVHCLCHYIIFQLIQSSVALSSFISISLGQILALKLKTHIKNLTYRKSWFKEFLVRLTLWSVLNRCKCNLYSNDHIHRKK